MEGSTIINEISPNGSSPNDKENQDLIQDAKPGLSLSDGIFKKIIQQCEFYFSDSNILKDQFLLNLVKVSPDGWVDLNVIENFRRLKKICEDHEVIKQALSLSTKLELSEDGLRIRRRDPLPNWDPSVYNRSVLISDFPHDVDVTIEVITNFFEEKLCMPYLVRVLLPGRRIPPDLKRSNAHAILGVQRCAVVEFKDHSTASEAISIIQKEWPNASARLLSAKIKNQNGEKSQKVQPNDKKYRPLILHGLNSTGNQIQVIHVRDPIAPPSEDSLGFPVGWREQLCLEKMSLGIARTPPEDRTMNSAHLVLNDSAIVSAVTSNLIPAP